MSLLVSGAYYIGEGDVGYYCESSGVVGICDRLSSGKGTRCYFNDTYKYCSEGWKPLENFINQSEVEEPKEPEQSFVDFIIIFANGEIYNCNTDNGKVNSYSICISETKKQGYLGELI